MVCSNKTIKDKREMQSISQRSRDILAGLSDNSQSKIARTFGVSRQWVNSLKRRHGEIIDEVHTAGQQDWELKDTGCLDGTYSSCLNCPLEECREDNTREAKSESRS